MVPPSTPPKIDHRLLAPQVLIQPADDVRPPKVLASAAALYAGGALYYAGLFLPHLGDFAITARLGIEPIGNTGG